MERSRSIALAERIRSSDGVMQSSLYYLSSLESRRFEQVRECRFVRVLRFGTGKECALVTLTPGVIGQPWGEPRDLTLFVLACRHEGDSLVRISRFPCFVHVARILDPLVEVSEEISAAQVETIAWCELYRTEDDARENALG